MNLPPTCANENVPSAIYHKLATGKSPKPADSKVCPTSHSDLRGILGEDIIKSMQSEGERFLVSGFHSRDALPHIKKEGASYFVTFRLAGTLPRDVLLQFKAEREAIIANALAARRPLTWREQEELFKWYSTRVDKYLDSGHGNCWLKRADLAEIVANAMRFHLGERFVLHAWVVMPNHVHAVLRPLGVWTLSEILKSWKGFSARKINARLKQVGKTFWQGESYDHVIRNENELHERCLYTHMNPVNAGLCRRPEEWKWSGMYKG